MNEHIPAFVRPAATSNRRSWIGLFVLGVISSPLAQADQNWDGDNPVGNMGFNNNWYGDNQPAWGFGNGNLVFNYRNNAGQTSIYNDYGIWVDTNDIRWDTTFGAGLSWNGAGQGINFNQRLQNDSSHTQTVGATMNLSGAKNGATQIELNPVNGNLTLNGAIFNDNSRPYAVYGNNGRTLTINTTLGVGATPGNVFFNIEQNSTVVVNNSQSYAGGTNIRAGVLEIANTNALGTFSGGAGYLGIANASTFRYTGTGSQSDGRFLWIDTGTQAKTIEVTSATGSLNFTSTGGQITQPLTKTGLGALILADGVQSRNLTVSGGTLTTGAITMNQSGGQTITVASGAGLTAPSLTAAWPVTIAVNGTGTYSVGSVSLTTGSSSSISGAGSLTASSVSIGNFMALNFGASGTTLTNSGNFSFAGTSTLNVTAGTLANTGSIFMSNPSTVNLSGGTLSTSGNYSMASTSTVNLSGGTLNASRFVTSDGSGALSTIHHSAGTFNITGSVNSGTASSFLLNHWGASSAASTYNLSGGVLNAPNAPLNLGWDGTARLIQTGGTANLQGINFNNGKNNAATYQLTSGRLNIGSYGMNGNASAKWLELNGGTLGAYANWSGGQQINVSATSTIDTLDAVDGVTGRTITINGVMSGAGGINKAGAGTLVSGGASTFTGNIIINGGVVEAALTVNNNNPNATSLGNMTTVSRTITINSGGTLRFTLSDAIGQYNYKTPVTLIADGGTITRIASANTFNSIGDVTLRNGGRIVTTNGNAPTVGSFGLNGDITVSGTSGSFIEPLAGQNTNNFINLGTMTGSTTFNVGSTGDPTADLTVSAVLGDRVLGGAATLIKAGTGKMVISSANTYTGGTTIRAGSIVAKNNGAVGTSGTVTLNDGSTGANNTSLLIDTTGGSVTISRPITVANQGSGTATIGSSAMGGVNQALFTGAISLNKDVTLSGATGGDRTQFSGGIGGTGNVTVTTAGTGRIVYITTANTYNGSTTVSASSFLQLSDATSTSISFIPDTSLLTVNGTINLAKGNNSETFGALAGTGTVQGHPGVGSIASAIVLGNGGGSATFSGLLSNGGAGGATLAVTKTGIGTQTFATANTYTGVTTVSGGVLRLDHATALPGGIGNTGGASALTFNGGVVGLGNGNFARGTGTGTAQVLWSGSGGFAAYGADRSVNLGGAGATAAWNAGSFVPTASALILGAADSANTIDFQNPIDFGASARTVQVDNGSAGVDAKLSGLLSGTGGGLTKTGAGTLQLIQATAYTGATAVNGGTLLLDGATAAVTSSSGVAIGSGATLLLSNTSALNNTDRLSNAGTVAMTGGTLNFSHTAGSASYSETTGALTVTSGANTLQTSQADVGQSSILTFASFGISGGSLNFSGTGIGLTPQNQIKFTTPPALNGSGLIASATLNSNPNVTYSLNDGVVLAVASAAIAIQSGVIPNGYISTVEINAVGTPGAITLATPTTTINTLTQNYAGPETGTVAMSGQTLRMGTATIESGMSALTFGAAPGSGTLMARDPGGELKLTNLSTAPMTVNAVIADNIGASTLTKTGTGTLVLAGAASYTGATAIQEGTLQLAGANRLPTGTALTLGAGTTSGILKLDGNNQQVGGLTTSGSGLNNRVVNGSATSATLTIGGSSTFAGVLGGTGANENNLALNVLGSPTLTGGNTFSGGVTLLTGSSLTVPVIATGGAQPLGQAGSAITFQGNSDYGSTLVYSGAGAGETNRGLNMDSGRGGTVSVTQAAAVLTVNGALSGASNFAKAGAGTLALTASDSWSGDGAVSGGTLVIGPQSGVGSNSISGGNWDIAGGATLRISTTGSVESPAITRAGTVSLEAGTLRTNNIAGSGALVWGNATLATLGDNTMGSVDRTGPGGDVSGPVVKEGNILNYTGNLSSSVTPGQVSILDLGTPLLNAGLRYNQIKITGTLDLSGADTLNFNVNPYFLRPTSPNSVLTGDWGTLILAYAETITGTFDNITGISSDGIGWTGSIGNIPTNPASLALNSYYIEYRTGFGPLAGGDAILFHYKVAGSVPEPGSAGLLVAGALLIRALRRR